ncbi:hypothetical protein MSAN_02341200 [Mycena sanguinolenta]|uniref:Uncharacterized protein n=1 Tax=Mycena sanguinolenta TaxID=230812 RepID=A0A8H7CF34_9AGAR|nr:hypothetical protein MSAN_02341200 [Mycena sanguinolenta]
MSSSTRAVLLEQRERTRKSSKVDIERFMEESESKITSLESQINALVELRDRERACVAALRHPIPIFVSTDVDEYEARNVNEHGQYPITFASFSTVPRLRKLRIHIYSHILPILVPWPQLTDLTLGAHCSNIALDILVQCPNLVQAAVSTTGRFSSPEARQNFVSTLSHLRVLSLPFFGPAGDVMQFLDHLAPAAHMLKELSMDFGSVVRGRWSQAHFTAFQRQTPNITHFELEWSTLTPDDLRTAIRHAPSLTHLKSISCSNCLDDALIGALSYKPGASPLAPHLHHLFLDDVGGNFAQDIFARMIASRWWTDDELVESRSPPVARWTRVELWGSHFGDLHNTLKDLPSDVLIYSF